MRVRQGENGTGDLIAPYRLKICHFNHFLRTDIFSQNVRIPSKKLTIFTLNSNGIRIDES